MRAVLSFLGLLLALAIGFFVMKQQVKQVPPAGPAAASSATPPTGGLPVPPAVGAQIQSALEQGAQRASEADH